MSKKNGDFNYTDSISLREYFEERINELEEKINLQFRMNQTALDKAEEKMNDRLERMNEFRDALKDASSHFVTRNELQSIAGALESDIKLLRESRAKLEGKASATSVYIAYGFSVLGIIVAIVGLLSK